MKPKWRVFVKNGGLHSEHDIKRDAVKVVKALAVGLIFRVPNTRDYIISLGG